MPTISEIQSEMMQFARKKDGIGAGMCRKYKTICNETECVEGEDCQEECEIIGHEILLSDVVKALPKYYRIYPDGWIENEGRVCVSWWDLSKPDFNSQEEETQRQIHAILFPNQK